MRFTKLPSNSRKLLAEIVAAGNPTQLLCDRLREANTKEADELHGILKELREAGYVVVEWADNKPFRVVINNSGRAYEELLTEYESEHASKVKPVYQAGTVTNNSIYIGDGNQIKNSAIGNKLENAKMERGSFFNKHPILTGVIVAVVGGVILMFSFWENLISWVEGVI